VDINQGNQPKLANLRKNGEDKVYAGVSASGTPLQLRRQQ
jgi:hypothetical protein